VTATNDEVAQALTVLFEALDEAYWVASDLASKDRIYGISRAVYAELTRLNRLAIAERGKKYRAIDVGITSAIEKLKKLQDEIDRLIHAIDTAAQVVSAIGTVLKLVGKVA